MSARKEKKDVQQLAALKRICEKPELHGFINNMYFYMLRHRYPEEFLEYTSQNGYYSDFRNEILNKINCKDKV